MRTNSSISIARLRAACGDSCRCARRPSTICWPIVCTGLSEVIGSWKIIDSFCPRRSRRSSFESFKRSRPSKMMPCPSTRPVSATSPITDSEVTLLPQPDSPTRPTVLPRSTLKLTPSTALNSPRSVSKWVRRSRTSSNASAISTNPLRSDVERLVEHRRVDVVRLQVLQLLVGDHDDALMHDRHPQRVLVHLLHHSREIVVTILFGQRRPPGVEPVVGFLVL